MSGKVQLSLLRDFFIYCKINKITYIHKDKNEKNNYLYETICINKQLQRELN